MTNLDAMLAGKRILAVDDLVESRSAMKKMLVILGATKVDVAMDGDEATEYILNNDYDLVISDYNLGRGRDGQQILEEARFIRRLKATTTFVMLTGENAMDMVMGAIEYEPDDYVTKPFTIDIMRQRLTRILTIKEQLRPINDAIDRQAKNEVLQLCDEYIKTKPRLKNRVERIKGRTLMSMKNNDEALKLYNSILEDHEITWALLGKATCLFHQGQYKESKTLLEYTIKQHPKYVQCYDLLAKIHLKNKDLQSAQNILVSATHVSPKQVLRQMELGRIAFANKDLAVAESAFRQSVKLARHSCYRSVKNYLLFAKAVQHKISPTNNRDTRAGSADAFKAIEEVKAIYSDTPEYVLEATMIESTTFTNLGKEADAKACADKAEKLLTNINEPSSAMLLSMANVFIATKQHAKAQDLLSEISKSKNLTRAEERELERTKSEISEQVVRQYTTEINDKAIAFFERGQLSQAIELLDQATAYKEAGLAVLLNAIQVKITYMDQRAASREMLDDVDKLLFRVGDIPASDDRHQRWLLLKKSQERLTRMI
ncbi:response regulator [Bermanella sp. WJH001]|mgnify:CR=1 FL=1|uniref:tetratricopeptide repeat-containing response regulator n=1 Tax=Bermanella sp. WJH001 TaxID=3048005 RepID=UPI0024BE21DB|nr:tetratricopeptide repeat-containing response regulator [Bermanella sp. WJH001]MDJ1538853.1 response regulator [Bermanella sp. WJH001]